MKKFKLPILLLAICLLVCLVCVMAACDGEKATDGTQDNTGTSPSTPEEEKPEQTVPDEEKPEQTVEELSKAECENILQTKTQNLLPSVEVANKHEIEFLKSADFSADFTISAVKITKVNLNGGEVYGSCTLTAHSDGALHSVYFVLKTNLFSLDRTSYEVLKEELANLNAYYVSVYENSVDIPATDGFFDFNSLVAGENVPSPLTEENYKAQCTEIINVKTLTGMYESTPSYVTISNFRNTIINMSNGLTFASSNLTAGMISIDVFCIFETNLNTLDITSYKELSENLSKLEISNMNYSDIIQSQVSDEAYANLVNFVISNSIGLDPAGTDVEILTVSTFNPGQNGLSVLNMIVKKGDLIYSVEVQAPTGNGSQEDQIKALLECQAEEITFTSTSESFSDFNDIGK